MNISSDRQSILIVDDMPVNIQILAGALKSDYQIKVASSGIKALEIAGSGTPPDLILLDIIMPEMNGHEVCRILKADGRTQNIPIIFITSKDEVEDVTKGLEIGAVDYITKPFHLPIVKARVNTQMQLKKKSDTLERLVSLDGLTNIPNRRRFDEVFETEWKRAQRTATSLSLIMIDIDFFKNYNDTYGHAAGDDCLKLVAQALHNSRKKAGDFVARYGGEEFVVILPATEIHGAATVADRLLRNVEMLNIPHAASAISDRVSLSAGIACAVPDSSLPSQEFMGAADKMLYKAKESGRNRFESTTLRH